MYGTVVDVPSRSDVFEHKWSVPRNACLLMRGQPFFFLQFEATHGPNFITLYLNYYCPYLMAEVALTDIDSSCRLLNSDWLLKSASEF